MCSKMLGKPSDNCKGTRFPHSSGVYPQEFKNIFETYDMFQNELDFMQNGIISIHIYISIIR